MIRTRLIATAASAPDQVITNDDLSKIVDTSDEWITQRTGIRERHISSGENTSVLVTDVASQLLHRASVSPENIDLIIVAVWYKRKSWPLMQLHLILWRPAAVLCLRSASQINI